MSQGYEQPDLQVELQPDLQTNLQPDLQLTALLAGGASVDAVERQLGQAP